MRDTVAEGVYDAVADAVAVWQGDEQRYDHDVKLAQGTIACSLKSPAPPLKPT